MKLFEKMEKKSEVGNKELKRRKRSVEKCSSAYAASNGECRDDKQVTDVALPSPTTDTIPSELATVETEAKCDDTESSVVNVVDAEAVAKTDTVTDVVQENERTDNTDNTASDVPATDIDIQSSHTILDGCLPPNESPIKPVVDPADTKLTENICPVKLDADSANTADIKDDLETVTVKAEQIEVQEKIPAIKLSELDTDSKYTEEECAATKLEESKTVTMQPMQTYIRAETVSTVTKTNITSGAKLRTMKDGAKPVSTAKLKFGMYARKPLASRMWVKVDEPKSESSSDSDGDNDADIGEESTAEAETTRKPQCHLVNIVW